MDNDISFFRMFRKIQKIIYDGGATFQIGSTSGVMGKGVCDSVASGQLSIAFTVANPGYGFPMKLLWC